MNGDLELLGERIAEHAAHLDAAMHRLLTDLREFDRRGGWHRQGAVSCAHWLAWRVGWSLVTARQHVRVANKLAELPAIDDALRRGQVSYAKVRAMARVATLANESLLLAYAQLMTASQLEAQCRKYALVLRQGEKPHPLLDEQRRYVRRRDTENGMVKLEAVLHPEEAELIWTMLNHAAAQLTRHPDADSHDDSAEPQAMSTVAADPTRDSAEPRAVVEKATDPTSDSAEPRAVVEKAADPTRDSAEPRAVVEKAADPARDSAEPRAVVAKAADPTGDSAEPRTVVEKSADPTRDSAEPRAVVAKAADPTRDSAEPQAGSVTGCAVVITSQGEEARQGAGGIDDAAISHEDTDPHRAAEPHGATQGFSVPLRCEDATRRAFSRADALVSIAQRYRRGERPDRSPIEITLTMSDGSLRSENVDPIEIGEIGQSFVSREVVRRLSCDAGVVEVIEDATGAPLSVGRKRRTISGSLKRALYKRDQSCTFPGCTHRLFLEGHHIRHWADGGETSLENTTLLCSFHHRHVHEYGYSIELGPDQRPRFRDPHGRLVEQVPERAERADLGWPWIRAMNEPLAITADTITCWDGTQVDYGTIVGHLLAADGLSS